MKDSRIRLAVHSCNHCARIVGSYVALSKPLVAVLPVFLLAWLRFEMPMTWATHKLVFLESLFLQLLAFAICLAGVVLATLPARTPQRA